MLDCIGIETTKTGVKVNHFPKKYCYVSLETGELMSYAQAIKTLEEEYDFDDWTPASEFWEYFDITDIPVDVLNR